MPQKTKTALIIIVGFIFVFWGLYFYSNRKTESISFDGTPSITTNVRNDTSTDTTTELSFVVNEKTTVYDLMDKLRKEGKINFIEKNYTGMGKFIVTINGLKNSGAENWIYYVNGEKAQTGVSNYKINPGDVVSWKYEKTSY